MNLVKVTLTTGDTSWINPSHLFYVRETATGCVLHFPGAHENFLSVKEAAAAVADKIQASS